MPLKGKNTCHLLKTFVKNLNLILRNVENVLNTVAMQSEKPNLWKSWDKLTSTNMFQDSKDKKM